MGFIDYYALLGVTLTSTNEELDEAKEQRLSEINGDDSGLTSLVERAHRILTHPVKSNLYYIEYVNNHAYSCFRDTEGVYGPKN